jgi:hypothetical protein
MISREGKTEGWNRQDGSDSSLPSFDERSFHFLLLANDFDDRAGYKTSSSEGPALIGRESACLSG